MGFQLFLADLFDRGRVLVSHVGSLSPEEMAAGDEILEAFETEYRKELPGNAPDLSMTSARWAAVNLYHACQFVVFRDADAATIDRTLQISYPESPSPSVHYSVDLTFRFLPDLLRLARTAAEQDPLLERLVDWGAQWPISSVGIPDISPVEIESFVDHPSMLGFYVDRIIARKDTSRLADSRVREAVLQALGLFPELAPEMAHAAKGNDAEEIAR